MSYYRCDGRFGVGFMRPQVPKEMKSKALMHCPLKDTGYSNGLVVDSTGSLGSTAICRFAGSTRIYSHTRATSP